MPTRNSSQRNYPRTKTIVISALEIVHEFGLVGNLKIGLVGLQLRYGGGPERLEAGRGWKEGWSGATSRARTQCQEREREMCVYVWDSLPCRLPSSPTATHRAPGGRRGTPPGS